MSLVIESELLESLGLDGAISGALADDRTRLRRCAIATGRKGCATTVMLVAWRLVSCGLVFRFYQRKSLATHHRLALTEDLVETMLGQRTRLAQSPKAQWHVG